MKYQIVRVKPTNTMRDVDPQCFDGAANDPMLRSINNQKTWDAMLQASPPAPSVEDIKELLKSLQGAWCVKDEIRNKATELLAQFEALEKEGSHD